MSQQPQPQQVPQKQINEQEQEINLRDKVVFASLQDSDKNALDQIYQKNKQNIQEIMKKNEIYKQELDKKNKELVEWMKRCKEWQKISEQQKLALQQKDKDIENYKLTIKNMLERMERNTESTNKQGQTIERLNSILQATELQVKKLEESNKFLIQQSQQKKEKPRILSAEKHKPLQLSTYQQRCRRSRIQSLQSSQKKFDLKCLSNIQINNNKPMELDLPEVNISCKENQKSTEIKLEVESGQEAKVQSFQQPDFQHQYSGFQPAPNNTQNMLSFRSYNQTNSNFMKSGAHQNLNQIINSKQVFLNSYYQPNGGMKKTIKILRNKFVQ